MRVIDLYKINFSPMAGINDFKKLTDKNNFDY